MDSKEYIFVFCKNYSRFLEYKNERPEVVCEYIVDGNTLRGRPLAKIVRYKDYEENLNFLEIEESCERAESKWNILREELENESNKDLDYGME